MAKFGLAKFGLAMFGSQINGIGHKLLYRLLIQYDIIVHCGGHSIHIYTVLFQIFTYYKTYGILAYGVWYGQISNNYY